MSHLSSRRKFIKQSSVMTGGIILGTATLQSCGGSNQANETDTAKEIVQETTKPFNFDISLAQWSFNKPLKAGTMDNLDFALTAKKEFGITAVEYVNQFFEDKAKDAAYIKEMKNRADGEGVESLLIMIDHEGDLGHTDAAERVKAVENHYKWVEAAQQLGCHSIRVNAAGQGTAEEVQKSAIEGLHKLSSFAKDFNINIIVENHGGYSSDGSWLSGVMKSVNLPNCGTLPDFGNFCIERGEGKCANEYDKYKGVKELMPYAKGVSAKSYDFDDAGNETTIDFKRMLQIVKDADYSGFIGIEYEGKRLGDVEGIRATQQLLERVRKELS